MSHRIKITVAIALLALWFASANPSTIDAGFVQVGATPTAGQLSIKAPNWIYVCGSSVGYQQWCAMVKDLAALNSPAVDAVLGKYISNLADANGTQIFPRP